MTTELADLVMAGTKRATASLARDYGEGSEPMPKPGDFVIVLDGEGCSRFIWRTTEVTIKPLFQVDEAFAWDEGEGDRARDWWLAAHRRYFTRQASREGSERHQRRADLRPDGVGGRSAGYGEAIASYQAALANPVCTSAS